MTNEVKEAAEVSAEIEEEVAEKGAIDGDAENGDDESPELVVQIGEEEPEEQEKAPSWVTELRRSDREKAKRIKELEAKLQEREEKPKLGPEPTLEDCDYDTDLFREKHREWVRASLAEEREQEKAREEQERAEQAWKAKLANYEQAKTTLGVKDYEDVEATVLETFNVTQQGIVIQGAENPALLAYALGKNPKRAKELASITDPIEFAFAVAKVEASLKVTGKGAPPPEKKLSSSVSGVSGAADNTLERLRAEAEKTGDYSKVIAYKRQKKG